jgi:hypothetical protein
VVPACILYGLVCLLYSNEELEIMNKEIKIKNLWLYFGLSFKRLAIGFEIDRYHVDIDLFFIWIGVEF